MTRGISTLKELIKRADSGRNVDESEIPPVVSVAAPKPQSTPTIVPENVSPSRIDPEILPAG